MLKLAGPCFHIEKKFNARPAPHPATAAVEAIYSSISHVKLALAHVTVAF